LKTGLLSACLAFASLFSLNLATAQESCGDVSISSMSWQSAELIAHIDAYILEKGLGCTIEIVVGDTVPLLLSMAERGVPDIVPEAHISVFPHSTMEMIEAGDLIVENLTLPDGTGDGVYIPKFIVDQHPELTTLAEIVKRPDLFPDPEDPGRGAWNAGQQGWGGTIILSALYKAYGAEALGWNLVDTGSPAGHSGSLIRAYERDTGWLGYMWEPTSILGRYDMVRVDEGVPYDEAEWNRCYLATSHCDDPKPNRWVGGDVVNLVTKDFAARGGVALDYFRSRSFKTSNLNKMLVWMEENQAIAEQGAVHYLKNYEEEWVPWLAPEIVAKIKASF